MVLGKCAGFVLRINRNEPDGPIAQTDGERLAVGRESGAEGLGVYFDFAFQFARRCAELYETTLIFRDAKEGEALAVKTESKVSNQFKWGGE